ncbi:hypothetical protein SAMN05444272_4106 [Roseibium suaedae]|uniref:Uncharacterized protein n=1 Tax=Roseibium suaedae TaxID=735517 RepID=A0A1M7P4P8_9HYPH|nr:hypothetical protein SAMN05444272_4106 [Roseibium suaedae]
MEAAGIVRICQEWMEFRGIYQNWWVEFRNENQLSERNIIRRFFCRRRFLEIADYDEREGSPGQVR